MTLQTQLESISSGCDSDNGLMVLKMSQSRPLFVYFRYFLITISIIEKSIDGVLGIRTLGRRMVGTDETTELWRPPQMVSWLGEAYFHLDWQVVLINPRRELGPMLDGLLSLLDSCLS